MKELIKKIVLFLAFCLFVYLSADMTATSLHLRWLSHLNYWIVFAIACVIAFIASWSLTRAIKELKSQNGNLIVFIVALIGFLVMWTISFSTNVHFQVLQEYGHKNLSDQLTCCKTYLKNGYNGILDKKIKDFQHNKDVKFRVFEDEVRNDGDDEQIGFGDHAEKDLKRIHDFLKNEAKKYNVDYIDIYNKEEYQKIRQNYRKKNRESLAEPLGMYEKRIKEESEKIEKAIKESHDKISKNEKEKYQKTITDLETQLKYVEKGNIPELFTICRKMEQDLLNMPGYNDYSQKKTTDNNGNEIIVNKVYPSTRMFNVANVWLDWFNGELPQDISLSGQFLLAAVVDAAAFVLICLI